MYLCYIDESGTSNIPGNTSHFVLAGLAIPIWYWKKCDRDITTLKKKYGLDQSEIHTAWILRHYIEQNRISNFEKLDYSHRRSEVEKLRRAELLRLQKSGNKNYRKVKKNFVKTAAYVHLTLSERKRFITEIAEKVSQWRFARLFAECIDKIHFDPNLASWTVDEQAFEQVISRFETYLQKTKTESKHPNFGLIIHDNNQTVAKNHTQLMKKFHSKGTLWTNIQNIIETPLFVDSQLTAMVQIADLCSYSIRRYLENGEKDLFKLIFERADRKHKTVVGMRHYTSLECNCIICESHKT